MTSKYVATGVAGPAYRIENPGGHGIRDVDHPPPRQAIPLAELEDAFAEWTAGVDRAKAAYYGSTKFYAARTAASQKQQRYRARKKAS